MNTIRHTGGADPDDLAIVVCAALRSAGLEPIVTFVTWPRDGHLVSAIRIYNDRETMLAGPSGSHVVEIPCSMPNMTPDLQSLVANAIQAAAILAISRPKKEGA